MAVDKSTVAHIAKLARIRVPEAQRESLAGELNSILGWVEQLGELDTQGIAPMTSVVEVRLPKRADAVTDPYWRQACRNRPSDTPIRV